MLGLSQKKIKAFWRFQALLAPATLEQYRSGLCYNDHSDWKESYRPAKKPAPKTSDPFTATRRY